MQLWLWQLQEGELPSQMVPKHNDDPYSDDDEEEQAEVRTPAASTAVPAAAFRFPLKLTSSLTGGYCSVSCDECSNHH